MRVDSHKSPKFSAITFFKVFLIVAFLSNFMLPSISYGQEVDLNLPAPSKIKPNSKPFNPAIIRAITIDPNDPFLFDFIIDKGDTNLNPEAFEAETQKLVKYFLAALTIPESDLWVNLSPYEQDAMVSPVLGVTELGKDLLIKDYYLKQVTAAMTNPNTPTGKKFWELAYAKAQELYGNTNVPINTFSKVWIVPDKAVVLEKDGSAFIAESYLKVFLDQDYNAVKHNLDNKEIGTDKLGTQKTQDINNFSAQIMKEVVLPEIEKEVNVGENFAAVRQIYASAILATWYKTRLKESILGKLYADQNKVAGVNAEDMDAGEKIFEKYTAALKTGAYNMIKQDYDLSSQKVVQRKYFSGGANLTNIRASTAIIQMSSAAASRAASNSTAVQMAINSMSSGQGIASSSATLVRATFRLVNASPAVLSDVRSKLSVPLERRDPDLGARTNKQLEALGVSFLNPVNSFNNPTSISDLAAVEVLARSSASEVGDFARRAGLDPEPLQSLRERVVAAAKKVKNTEYRQVFRSFISQIRSAMTPAARQSVVQAKDADQQSMRALQAIGESTDNEFNTIKQSFTSEQRSDLDYVREQVRSLASGQTVVNLMTAQDERLNNVLVSPALATFSAKPAPVTLTLNERKQVATMFVSKLDVNTRVALTRMGYNREEVAYLMSAQGRKDLVEIVEENPDLFLLSAKIDPTTILALQKVADPYGSIVSTEQQYRDESTNLYSDLVKQGFNREVIDQVVKVRAELKTAALDKQNITSDDVIISVWTAGFSKPVESFVQTLREKPVLTRAFINARQVAPDRVDEEIVTAQKLLDIEPERLNSDILSNSVLNFTREQQDAIRKDIADIKVARMRDPLAPIFAAKHGAAIAKAVADPVFIRLVSRTPTASSSPASTPIVTPSERAVAVLMTTELPELQAILKSHFAQSENPNAQGLSDNEVGLIAEAMMDVATGDPAQFDYPERARALQTALERRGSNPQDAVDWALIASDTNELKGFTSLTFDARVRTLSALSNPALGETELSNALLKAGIDNSQTVAKDVIVARNAHPQQQSPTMALADSGNTESAVAINNAAANPDFQRAMSSYAPQQNELDPIETRLALDAATLYSAYQTTPVAQQTRIKDALRTISPNTVVTPQRIKVWLAKAQGVKPQRFSTEVPELAVFLGTKTRISETFAAIVNRPAARTLTSPIQNVFQSVKVAAREDIEILPADDKLLEFMTGIANKTSRSPEKRIDPRETTVTLRAIAFQTTVNSTFRNNVFSARNLAEVVDAVSQEMDADPQFAENVSMQDIRNLTDADMKTVGGIDLSADKMGLQIKRDGKGVPLPISDQDIKNFNIEGLTPVILDVQPATPASVPFLMNLANGTQAK